jgi:DNA-binding transcriptional regulator YdaS (Cro superfamily)
MDIRDIIRTAGGPSHLARLLGLRHSTISEWRRVPAEHVGPVAKASGLAPALIRPDVFAPVVGSSDTTAGEGDGATHNGVAAPQDAA